MPQTYDLLAWFGLILAAFYLILWLVAPRKWLFSLVALIYAIAMIFIADGVRIRYGGSSPLYPLLNATIGIAIIFVVLLPIVEGIVRVCLIPFIRASDARSRITDAVYWFTAGAVAPFVFLQTQLFARYSGIRLLPILLATAIVTLIVFFILRRRGISRNFLLLMPGYSLGIPILLAVSVLYGAKVSSAASTLAGDTPYCLRSGPNLATSMLDMTPLTLMSRGISEYHAELIVETKPKAGVYNWSWQKRAFAPITPDHVYVDSCSEL